MKKRKVKTSQKIRYEVSDLNTLIISKPYDISSPLRKKTIVKGYFKVDRNRLSYYISSRDKKLEDGIPYHKITFKGKWFLNKEHNLKFTLDESKTQVFGDTLILKGEILKVDSRGLTFRLRKRTTPTRRRLKSIRLGGFWQADENNRLMFNVRKEDEEGSYLGKLIFEGAWQINKQNELLYRYQKETLKTKYKKTKNLVFRGYWQLGRKRLIYQLKGYKKSFFSFAVSLKTPSLKAHENKIKYQVGIEYETKKNLKRKVVKVIGLFGRWKIRKDLSLAFEIKQSEGELQTLTFENSYYFNKNNEITFRVKDKIGKDIDFEVCFTKKFLKDKELFLKLKKEEDSRQVEAAVRVPF